MSEFSQLVAVFARKCSMFPSFERIFILGMFLGLSREIGAPVRQRDGRGRPALYLPVTKNPWEGKR